MRHLLVFGAILIAIRTLIHGPMPKAAAEPEAQDERPMTEAEVNRALTEAAGKNAEKLDWQHSIVDLLKLLDLNSSLEARKELAAELGYTAPVDGSDESNVGLHKAVMDAVANRCIVPQKE